ncbi:MULTISPECIES: LysR family transcriptional regulator [unclassified Chelatococcus]|uniref:Transcriptional regulator, LysR family n=2 Tax=Chelatococcus sambhunathii TaxID=363953 RepID=A0ABP2A918_9HYPH|nr:MULTISPECIES: LysR family transcriptional regulator [unclassified Chelatococcus]ALA19763.1 hypothetical protein AL346_15200 [Chelatococcus sp. CO-6]CUA89254.1 transcriptional regulator, LysR family [Chelatococcus sambhunathii]
MPPEHRFPSQFDGDLGRMTAYRYLTAAAQNGSFRRAAEALGIRQSTISRSVRAMEDRLGVSLFHRGTAGIRLTNAGRRFLDEVLPAIEQLALAAVSAAAAGRAAVGSLRIGTFPGAFGGLFGQIMRSFAAQYPDVLITIEDEQCDGDLGRLQRRRLDIGFMASPTPVPGCEVVELWREPLFVALPPEHVLAARDLIDWKALRQEAFLVTKRDPGPAIRNHIVTRTHGTASVPDVALCSVSPGTLLHLVSLGQGITLVPASWTDVQTAGILCRPLADSTEALPVRAVWSARNDNPALRRFLSVAHMLAGQHRRGTSDWSGRLPIAASGPRPTHQ